MDPSARIETALQQAMARASGLGSPAGLRAAGQHAVFPGGARIRPQLCLAVAAACGDARLRSAGGAATAIELLHCASLVHDDLPCFDDAAMRRGVPSVHHKFGQPLAVLTGDALIVLAFETLAHDVELTPQKLASLLMIVCRATGMPHGIAAGQAWELEETVPLRQYQRAKTGALFVAATTAGAVAADANPAEWTALGELIGEAYQIADDIRDAVSTMEEIGKPVGQDVALSRPSAVREFGLDGAYGRLEELIGAAIGSIPNFPGAAELRQSLMQQTARLTPKNQARVAA